MPTKKTTKKPAKSAKRAPKHCTVSPAFIRSLRIASACPADPVARRPIPKVNSGRFTLWVFSAIIFFFVAATFYIAGYTKSFLRMHHEASIPTAAFIDMSAMTDVERFELSREYITTGRDRLLAGNITGAILDLSIAVEADPFNPLTYIYRGEAFMQASDLGRAFDDFTMAIDLDANNPVAWYNRAIVHARGEDFVAAIDDLTNALAANNTHPSTLLTFRDILARRGQMHLWTFDFDMAISDYTAAINSNRHTQNPNDFAGRAEALTAVGEFNAAAADYLTAITLISEQIQIAQTPEAKELMSRQAVLFFEKSAALNVAQSDFIAARSDLESAITIANALRDFDTIDRLMLLMNDI